MAKSKKPAGKSSLKEDALAPAAKTFGTEIAPLGAEVGQAVTVTVRTLLRPVLGTVWGANQIMDFIQNKVEARTAKIPPERLIEPDIRIVGPAIEAARFSQNDETLQDLFAAIIANSMDSHKSNAQHPSYVEVIKQLNTTDANIIRKIKSNRSIACVKYHAKAKGATNKIALSPWIADFNVIENADSEISIQSIENLIRLKILDLLNGHYISDLESYKFANVGDMFEHFKLVADSHGRELDIEKSVLQATTYGILFANAVE